MNILNQFINVGNENTKANNSIVMSIYKLKLKETFYKAFIVSAYIQTLGFVAIVGRYVVKVFKIPFLYQKSYKINYYHNIVKIQNIYFSHFHQTCKGALFLKDLQKGDVCKHTTCISFE